MFHDTDGSNLVVPAGFHVYQRTPLDDTLLLQFYTQATQDGSLRHLFYDMTISGVFQYLSPGRTITVMRLRDNIPWLVAWFEPCFDGAFLGFWAARDMRHRLEGRNSICALLDAGLDRVRVVLGTTRAELIDGHTALGYTELGAVPLLWDGRDVHYVYLTRQDFEASKIVQRWRRYKKD